MIGNDKHGNNYIYAYICSINGFPKARWIACFALLGLYLFRVFYFNGWYIVTYALFIYLLNLFILFLTPQVDPEEEGDFDTESLPTNIDDEHRPFVRRLPEFKFWYAVLPTQSLTKARISITRAVLIALFFTTSRAFDIPVYWPILLAYFLLLFVVTMRKRIVHMMKYKYLPFNIGKKTYDKPQQQQQQLGGFSSPKPTAMFYGGKNN